MPAPPQQAGEGVASTGSGGAACGRAFASCSRAPWLRRLRRVRQRGAGGARIAERAASTDGRRTARGRADGDRLRVRRIGATPAELLPFAHTAPMIPHN